MAVNERDTLIGNEGIDNTTRAYLEKKTRTTPSRTLDLLKSRGMPDPGSTVGASNIDQMFGEGTQIAGPAPAPAGQAGGQQAGPQPGTEGPGTGPGITAPQRPEAQAAEALTRPAAGDRGVAADMALQTVGGARDAAESVLQGAKSISSWLLENSYAVTLPAGASKPLADMTGATRTAEALQETGVILPPVDGPQTLAGGLTRGIVQFTAGFLPALKGVQGLGLAAKVGQAATVVEAAGAGGAAAALAKGAAATAGAAENVAASALTNFAGFDPHAERLSNFIQEFPILKNPITKFLAADPADSEIEGRLKNTLEGVGIDTALAVAFTGALKIVRGMKKMKGEDAMVGKAAEMGFGEEKPTNVKIDGPDASAGAAVSPDAIEGSIPKKPGIDPAANSISEDFLKLKVRNELGTGRAHNINLAKIDKPEDIQALIEQTAESFKGEMRDATRSVQTNQITEALADELGMTPEDLLARQKGQAMNAEQAVAARRILVSSALNLRELAGKVASLEATDVDRLSFRRAVALHAAIQQQVTGATAEAGRALQSFRIMAKGQREQMQAIKNLLEASGGRSTTDDLAQAVLDTGTAKGVNALARELYAANGWDMIFETWVNAILSGPRTHMVNTASNAINLLIGFPEKATAAVLGKVFKSTDRIQPGEVMADAYGLIRGYKEAWSMAAEAFRTEGGLDPLTKLEVRDTRAITAENLSRTFLGRRIVDPTLKVLGQDTLMQHGAAASMVDGLGSAIRFLGFRMLNSEDAFFKALNYRMAIHSQAFREATAEGLHGEALAKRVAELAETPSESARIAAGDVSHYNTFTNPNSIATKIGEVTRAWPLARYIIPFTKTPANIVNFVLDRTPFALMGSQIRGEVMAGGARRDLALARISLGTGAMATAWQLSASGKITGSAPANPALRNVWLQENQEYSIVLPQADGSKKFVSYNRLEPIGMLFGVAADYGTIASTLGEKEANEVVAAGVSALWKNLASKTWLQGVATLIDAIDASDESADKLGKLVLDIQAGFLPNFVNQTNGSLIDPVLRETRGAHTGDFAARTLATYMDALKAKTPGYSQTLPPRRNVWGEPIEPRQGYTGNVGDRAWNLLTPAYQTRRTSDKVNETIINNEIELETPGRTISVPGTEQGIELTAAQYSRYVELAGKPAKKALDEKVAEAGWESMPKFAKAAVVRNIVSAFRLRAKMQLIHEDKDLAEKIKDVQDSFRNSIQGGQ